MATSTVFSAQRVVAIGIGILSAVAVIVATTMLFDTTQPARKVHLPATTD